MVLIYANVRMIFVTLVAVNFSHRKYFGHVMVGKALTKQLLTITNSQFHYASSIHGTTALDFTHFS